MSFLQFGIFVLSDLDQISEVLIQVEVKTVILFDAEA
jgi:hypothetical protein